MATPPSLTNSEEAARLHAKDERVPDAAHYDADYAGPTRFFSFAQQIASALEVRPQTVLEVGVGTGVTAHMLRRVGVRVTTLDAESSLSPDLLADVRDIPAADGAFDVTCCCQVLEHLPWQDFPSAISELRRVTRKRLVLSLPDSTRFVSVSLALPVIGPRRLEMSLPIRLSDSWKRRRLDTFGHYWEIGYPGVRAADIDRTLRSSGFARVATFRVRELPWHRFFVADVS